MGHSGHRGEYPFFAVTLHTTLLSCFQPYQQRQLPVRLPAEVAAPVAAGQDAAGLRDSHLCPPRVAEGPEHLCRAARGFRVW